LKAAVRGRSLPKKGYQSILADYPARTEFSTGVLRRQSIIVLSPIGPRLSGSPGCQPSFLNRFTFLYTEDGTVFHWETFYGHLAWRGYRGNWQ
jgi:hypothetical protein